MICTADGTKYDLIQFPMKVKCSIKKTLSFIEEHEIEAGEETLQPAIISAHKLSKISPHSQSVFSKEAAQTVHLLMTEVKPAYDFLTVADSTHNNQMNMIWTPSHPVII